MVRIDLRELKVGLPNLLDEVATKQLPFAIARTLSRVGKESADDVRKALPVYIDRPTPWTIRGVLNQAATKKDLRSIVWFMDGLLGSKEKLRGAKMTPAARYMAPNVFGGQRDQKRIEAKLEAKGVLPPGRYIVPTKFTKLDKFGNISRGLYSKIMANLQLNNDPGYTANETEASRKRNRRKRKTFSGFQYFTPIAGKRRGAARALFEKHSFAMGEAIRPILAFVKKRPSYKKRFPFFEIATRFARARYMREFPKSLEHAIATAHFKSAKSFNAQPRAPGNRPKLPFGF